MKAFEKLEEVAKVVQDILDERRASEIEVELYENDVYLQAPDNVIYDLDNESDLVFTTVDLFDTKGTRYKRVRVEK